uniref:Uncharacterized protein n=1 Tax=Sphaerodactylus townsendi TaxID=933632 RepID=A0ACB8FCJ9_9SAUR
MTTTTAAAPSLLARRGRLKRDPPAAAAAAAPRSLDRRALLLLHPPPPPPPRHLQPLQAPERDWVRRDLQRGCVHVLCCRHRHPQQHPQHRGGGGGCCSLRPVLCTLETPAAQVAARLLQRGAHAGGALRVVGKDAAAGEGEDGEAPPAAPSPSPSPAGSLSLSPVRRPRNRRGRPRPAHPHPHAGGAAAAAIAAPPEGSPGRASSQLYLSGPPLSCPSLLGASDPESSSDRLLAAASSSASASSSDELEEEGDEEEEEEEEEEEGSGAGEPPGKDPGGGGRAEEAGEDADAGPALYVQLPGEPARRLEAHEKPLQLQHDYLAQLGLRDPWRLQDEGLDAETGCLIRFYAEMVQQVNVLEVRG